MSDTRQMSVTHRRADRARHILLGASLVIAPTLLLIASIIRPVVDWSSSREAVSTAATEAARWQASGLVELFGFMLIVPAIIAAAELIRSRYPGLALATVILVGASAMLIVGAVFYTMMLAAAEGLDEAAIAEYLSAGESLGGMAFLIPFFFTAYLGYLLLAFGLWRTRATPRWVPVLFLGAFGAAQMTTDSTLVVLTNLGVAIASAGMAWAYLTGEEDPAPAVAPRMRPVAI